VFTCAARGRGHRIAFADFLPVSHLYNKHHLRALGCRGTRRTCSGRLGWHTLPALHSAHHHTALGLRHATILACTARFERQGIPGSWRGGTDISVGTGHPTTSMDSLMAGWISNLAFDHTGTCLLLSGHAAVAFACALGCTTTSSLLPNFPTSAAPPLQRARARWHGFPDCAGSAAHILLHCKDCGAPSTRVALPCHQTGGFPRAGLLQRGCGGKRLPDGLFHVRGRAATLCWQPTSA